MDGIARTYTLTRQARQVRDTCRLSIHTNYMLFMLYMLDVHTLQIRTPIDGCCMGDLGWLKQPRTPWPGLAWRPRCPAAPCRSVRSSTATPPPLLPSLTVQHSTRTPCLDGIDDHDSILPSSTVPTLPPPPFSQQKKGKTSNPPDQRQPGLTTPPSPRQTPPKTAQPRREPPCRLSGGVLSPSLVSLLGRLGRDTYLPTEYLPTCPSAFSGVWASRQGSCRSGTMAIHPSSRTGGLALFPPLYLHRTLDLDHDLDLALFLLPFCFYFA